MTEVVKIVLDVDKQMVNSKEFRESKKIRKRTFEPDIIFVKNFTPPDF